MGRKREDLAIAVRSKAELAPHLRLGVKSVHAKVLRPPLVPLKVVRESPVHYAP